MSIDKNDVYYDVMVEMPIYRRLPSFPAMEVMKENICDAATKFCLNDTKENKKKLFDLCHELTTDVEVEIIVNVFGEILSKGERPTASHPGATPQVRFLEANYNSFEIDLTLQEIEEAEKLLEEEVLDFPGEDG